MKKRKFAEEDRIANAQRAGCVVIILVVVAIVAFLGVRVYEDMDDNGMSRYMNAYDDEDWE